VLPTLLRFLSSTVFASTFNMDISAQQVLFSPLYSVLLPHTLFVHLLSAGEERDEISRARLSVP